ncbi:tape measure domain-containing protein [Rhizobium rosettiformans]|uniref:Tape measure protein n=2 Tax=Rhizobium rosettiformans TaxID=1368430 RepID=A0A4S8PPL3_9HYPH|nr:tape measure protein [Rhizobium rosettiformans]MBB5277787.1 tape measure domain-containing protein [Rhizobium rosettiformans]THV32948.1 hypothetical protein FAA86_18835 [Rhizobium rosettiformans W3]
MSETHSINLNINATGAKRGATEYKAAINQITAATQAYKKAVESFGRPSVDFSKMARDLNALSGVRFSASTAKNIQDLGTALRNFRGPSASQLKGTRDFLRVIASASVNPSVARNIAAVSAAFSTFRGPTRNNAAAVRELFRALNSARMNPATAGQLAAITASLSGFRGPSAAAVRNVDAMVTAINRLRTPPDMGRLVSALNQIAHAAQNANTLLTRLSQSHRGNVTGMRSASSATLSLTGNMRGLENAMSLSYQAGSQLRVLLGSLTLGQFTQGVYNATLSAQRFETAMGVASKTAIEQQSSMNFAAEAADKYGMSLVGIREEYGKFYTSARLAGQSVENTQFVFESMSGAMRVMGVDAMGQARSFKALTQMFSKGAVMAEELRQQLGEQLPAAFPLMQEALSEHLGKKVDLSKMLELGQVSDDAVVLLAKKMAEVFGPQIIAALDRADTKIGQLQNSWTKFQELVGKNGVMDAFGDVARALTDVMESAEFKGNAVAISQALGDTIRALGDAAIWALKHVKELGAVMLGVMSSGLIAGIAKGISVFGMLGSVGGIVSAAFAAIPMAVGAAGGALAYYWDTLVQVGETSVTVGTMATQAFYDVRDWILNASTAADSFSLQGIVDAIILADTATATGFNNMAQNGEMTAAKFKLLFQNAGWVVLAELSKMLLSFGVYSNKLIATAARNMDYYTSKLNPFKSEDERLAEYKANLESDIAALNRTLESGSKAIDEWFQVDELYKQSGDILKPVLEAHAEHSKQLQELRDKEAAARKAELDQAARDREQARLDTLKLTDTSDLNPLRGDMTGDKNAVTKRAKDAEKAVKDYRAEIDALNSQLQAGKITLDQYNAGIEFQTRKMQEVSDPYAAMVRSMNDEVGLQNMASRAREIEIAHREKINELAEKGIHVTAEQSAKLRELITTQQKMNDRPLKEWVDGIEDIGVATDRVAVTAIEGLSDNIAEMVVTGKADFASLAQSILKDFIKVGLQSMMKDTFSSWFGGAKSATQEQLSTAQKSKDQANAWNLGQQAQSWDLKGGFGLKGAPQNQHWEMKGGFGLDGAPQATNALAASVSTATPQIDAMATGAVNAANALNSLATAAGGKQVPFINQPMPASQSAAAATAYARTGVDPMQVTQSAARMAATPYNLSSKTLSLTPQEITDLKKTLMTEVDASLTGPAYESQAAGVVDTILNRKVSGKWGDSVTSVVNAKSQFSDINGPVAWKNGRQGVEYLSDSLLESGRGKRSSEFVDQYLAKRAAGQASSVGGNLHYANPAYSDAKNQEWISKLDGPTLGAGDRLHKHGTTAGFKPVDPNYGIKLPGQPSTNAMDFVGNYKNGVDQRLTNILEDASKNYEAQTGYKVEAFSGLRPGDKRLHGQGLATDVRIIDPATGKEFGNYQDESGFRTYEQFAQQAKMSQERLYPDMDPEALRWGGYFSGDRSKYGSLDSMHFDLGGERGLKMGGGSWENGLSAQQRAFYPNAVSVGMGQQQQQQVDPMVTSSIQQVNTQLQTLGTTASQASMQTQTKIAADQQAGMAVQTAGQQALQASPGFQQAGQSIQSASQQAQAAQPGFQQMSQGLGALMGPLSSVIPGLGQFGGAIMSLLGSLGSSGGMGGGGLGALFGLFAEGGLATAPVAMGKMPHFAEGTANTGSYGRGGIPSVLHPNEAVIPLSRGRKVPVEMNTREEKQPTSEFAAARQGGGNTFNLNLTGLKSADDFKRNQRQISQRLAHAQERTQRRNA